MTPRDVHNAAALPDLLPLLEAGEMVKWRRPGSARTPRGVGDTYQGGTTMADDTATPPASCDCGCGSVLNPNRRPGRRFRPGHNNRKVQPGPPINPSGVCQCGCGSTTPISRATGEHSRFAVGHYDRTPDYPAPNPSGLCQCGCGQTTPLATRNRQDKGLVKGEHVRYLRGHAPFDPDKNAGQDECACGCGHKAPAGKAFRRGHQHRSKGYTVNPSGCWIWQGGKSRAGYARSRIGGGRMVLVYRWMWEQKHGRLPRSLVLHHECSEKSCVNPDHLRPVSRAEHMRIHAIERQ